MLPLTATQQFYAATLRRLNPRRPGWEAVSRTTSAAHYESFRSLVAQQATAQLVQQEKKTVAQPVMRFEKPPQFPERPVVPGEIAPQEEPEALTQANLRRMWAEIVGPQWIECDRQALNEKFSGHIAQFAAAQFPQLSADERRALVERVLSSVSRQGAAGATQKQHLLTASITARNPAEDTKDDLFIDMAELISGIQEHWITRTEIALFNFMSYKFSGPQIREMLKRFWAMAPEEVASVKDPFVMYNKLMRGVYNNPALAEAAKTPMDAGRLEKALGVAKTVKISYAKAARKRASAVVKLQTAFPFDGLVDPPLLDTAEPSAKFDAAFDTLLLQVYGDSVFERSVNGTQSAFLINDRCGIHYLKENRYREELLRVFDAARVDYRHWRLEIFTSGGGESGQNDAMRYALARAMLKFFPERTTDFHALNLSLVDTRKKQPKRPGRSKARRGWQFTKR